MSNSQQFGVTFDLWHTLIADADGNHNASPTRIGWRARFVRRALAEAGLDFELEHIRGVLEQTNARIFAEQATGGDMKFERRLLQVLQQVGIEAKRHSELVGKIGQAIDDAFRHYPPQLITGALDTLRWVRTQGVKIALISNAGINSDRLYYSWFDELNISRYFDFAFLSNEQECAKPANQAFAKTLKALGVTPQNTLHVGDNPITDVQGAQNAGLSTVLVGDHTPHLDSEIVPHYKIPSVAQFKPVFKQWQAKI